jgi:hypothetical protein
MEAKYSSETVSNKLHGVASYKTATFFEQYLHINVNYMSKVEANVVILAVLGP